MDLYIKKKIFFTFFLCVCVHGGGGSILVKGEKNAKCLDFSEDCMFCLTPAITYFQFDTN